MNTYKRIYKVPDILVINLDNNISLQLASDPPVPENEIVSAIPEIFNQNPFNINEC